MVRKIFSTTRCGFVPCTFSAVMSLVLAVGPPMVRSGDGAWRGLALLADAQRCSLLAWRDPFDA